MILKIGFCPTAMAILISAFQFIAVFNGDNVVKNMGENRPQNSLNKYNTS